MKNSDFSGLRFSKPTGVEFDERYGKVAMLVGVSNMQDLFKNTASSLMGAFSTEDLPDAPEPEINELAERFDNEDSPNKSHNSSKISMAHPEFQKYIKAFIIKCKDKGISIYLNSTHRNRAAQQKLIDEHKRGERRIKPAKYSYHISGLAFDFNPTTPDGKTINSRMSKQIWINSGVPAIGESVGLRWGGYFSTNYDPIHFDFGKKVSKNRNVAMIKEADSKAVEVTSIPTKAS